MSILRSNSQLREYLGEAGVDFLEWGLGAIERILPHSRISSWTEIAPEKVSGAVWTSPRRTEVRVTVVVGSSEDRAPKSLQAMVQRRNVPVGGQDNLRTLDLTEHDICKRVASRLGQVLCRDPGLHGSGSLRSLKDAFDEQVIIDHLLEHHGLDLDLNEVLNAIHKLAEQTYENKSLAFGAILDPALYFPDCGGPIFPQELFSSKKYKALSDGFRTAYHVSTCGHLVNFVDLAAFRKKKKLTARHHFPEWLEDLAGASRDRCCGIALSQQGDILLLDEGSLRFSYRYGHWHYWNHSHLTGLLSDRARAQHVAPRDIGEIVRSIYRAALDVSFRRTGGMFVLLRNKQKLDQIVPRGDELGSSTKGGADAEFDGLLQGKKVQSLPRRILVELASLDGAVVVANSGNILAFGSVLQPKKKGRLKGTEGSRTKAAIGASHYGLVLKISADGDITVYHDGKEFLRV